VAVGDVVADRRDQLDAAAFPVRRRSCIPRWSWLPSSGAHQVALDDGQFAECDDTVTVTAVSAAEPS
jgi:hypothetical protein